MRNSTHSTATGIVASGSRHASSALTDQFAPKGVCFGPITTATGQRAPGGGRSAQMASGVYGETCGVDLVKYLHDVDQWPTVDGTNTIKTYTIGFNLSGSTATQAGEFLRELAEVGGGQFYEAASSSELVNVFNAIISQAKQESGSFTAPALSVNAYNRLFNRDSAYLTLFEPSTKVRWMGNMKKFGLCTATDGSCEFGELLDVNGNAAVILDPVDPDFGQLDPNARGYWSSAVDSALEVLEGGTGVKMPASGARQVYVHKDRAAPDPISNPTGTALYLISTADTTDPVPTVPETDLGTLTLKELLYDTDGDLDADNCDSGGPDNGCLNTLINWMLGATGPNVDEPLRPIAGHRWAWSDQLHSEPLVISFGGTEAAPVIKLFGGTNDGGFFMANESTGVEEWIAYPQATLGMQELLMGYTDATNRSYGMDAKPSGRLKDVDGDGIIEAADGDYVHVYIGMRRGGRNLYAFNVTPDSPLTDPDAVGGIAPKMLWRIEGGVSTGYGRLGQTWATAIPTKIAVGAESRTVLVMSGGYDPGQDSGFGSDDGMVFSRSFLKRFLIPTVKRIVRFMGLKISSL